jgi:16S rRNA (cytidine1402-2'-O)-methyltransferase
MSTLYIVSTPIGNLEDISLRALRVLREARLIAVEDTRHARVLLQRYEIATPTIAYHEHNKDERIPTIIAALAEGDVALISDAGTPGLSDPGYELINAALDAGHTVTAVPGASALLSALVVSGLPFAQFTYVGFPPRRSNERRKWFAALATEPRSVVLYEAPHRLRASLADLQAALGPDRAIVVARELTKLHEEVLRKSIAAAIAHFAANNPRGEFVIIVPPLPHPNPPAGNDPLPNPPLESGRENDALAQMDALVAGGLSVAAAAKEVAGRLHLDRRELYRQYVEMKG